MRTKNISSMLTQNRPTKKGQVTLFILIGVIILIGVTVVTFTAQDQQEQATEQVVEEQERRSTSSEETQEIESRIQSCMRDITVEGLEKLSRQGGYLNPEEAGVIHDARNAYDNTGVDFFGDGSQIVPYWLASDDDPTCTSCEYDFYFPSLLDIQLQTQQYVEQNIEGCVDFEQFEEFDIESSSNPITQMRFTPEATEIQVNWDITVENTDGDTFRLNTFSTQSQLDFYNLYSKARALLNTIRHREDVDQNNLANMYTINVLRFLAFDETIPPLNQRTETGRSSASWQIQNVIDEAKNSLSGYSNLIQIGGYEDTVEVPASEGQFSFLSSTARQSYNPLLDNTTINAFYRPSWPLFLQINGGETNIRPDITSLGVSFIRLSRSDHDYLYDVAHPVVFSVRDEDIAPFPLRFGVESNIRGSKPFEESPRATSSSAENQQVEPSIGFNLPQGGSKDITVNLQEEGVTLEDTGGLEFECAAQRINLIDQAPENNKKFETSIPACIPATIQYRGSDAFSEKVQVTTQEEYTIDVFELQDLSIEPQRYNYLVPSTEGMTTRQDWLKTQLNRDQYVSPASRHPDEEVTVVFNGINTTDFSSAATLEGLGTESLPMQPGQYEVTVVSNRLFGEERELKSFETESTEEGGVAGIRSETVEGQEFNDSFLLGKTDYTVNFSIDNLRGEKTLEVPYIAIDLEEKIRTTKDLQYMTEYTNKSYFPQTLQLNLR